MAGRSHRLGRSRGAEDRSRGSIGLLLSPFGVGPWQATLRNTASPETSPSPGSEPQLLPSQLLHSSPMGNCQIAKYRKVRYRQVPTIFIGICLWKACLFCGIAFPFVSILGLELCLLLSFSCCPIGK